MRLIVTVDGFVELYERCDAWYLIHIRHLKIGNEIQNFVSFINRYLAYCHVIKIIVPIVNRT